MNGRPLRPKDVCNGLLSAMDNHIHGLSGLEEAITRAEDSGLWWSAKVHMTLRIARWVLNAAPKPQSIVPDEHYTWTGPRYLR